MVGKMNNKELFEALRMFEKEKDIPMDYMLQQIQKAIEIACKSYYGGNENVVFKADPDKNTLDVKLVKTVTDDVLDPNFEVTPEEAAQINKRKKYEIGDEIEVPLDPKRLGRIAVASARNVIRQGIRAGEKGVSLIEFQSKLGEIVTATVERIDQKSGVATIRIGKSTAMLPAAQGGAGGLGIPARGRHGKGLYRRRQGQRERTARDHFALAPGLCAPFV